MNTLMHWITGALAAFLLIASATSTWAQLELHSDTLRSQNGAGDNQKAERDVSEEAPEPSDPRERAAREAKNRRYNTGGADITRRNPETEYFAERVWPRGLPLIPVSESAVIVLGTLVGAQPYLSQDRSRIYTELTVRIEEVFENQIREVNAQRETLVLDWPGGDVRLRSRHIVRNPIIFCYLGKPRVGRRYVLFAQRIHKGKDLEMVKGYELRAGKVFTLPEDDGVEAVLLSSKPHVPEEYSDEETFLKAIRQALRRAKR